MFFQCDLWHHLREDPFYPIFIVWNKEEISVYFQHKFLVSGYYVLCHPIFFFSSISDFHKPSFSQIIFSQLLPIHFSVHSVGSLAFHPPWGSLKSTWGPETRPASDGVQAFHSSMATVWLDILLQYILSTFFPNTAITSVQLFSQRPSL